MLMKGRRKGEERREEGEVGEGKGERRERAREIYTEEEQNILGTGKRPLGRRLSGLIERIAELHTFIPSIVIIIVIIIVLSNI